MFTGARYARPDGHLNAWIWRPNPLGMFANYNPNVKMCPGH